MTDLHQIIAPDENSVSTRVKKCVLHGLGGTGKTQTALEYTYRFRKYYDYIFWLRAEHPYELAESYSVIAAVSGVQADVDSVDQKYNIKLAWEWLASTGILPKFSSIRSSALTFTADNRWLLVFDNVDSVDAIKPYLPAAGQGSIIFTTQTLDLESVTRSSFHIKGVGNQDGAKMLLGYLYDGNHDEKLAVQISDSVGGLPLAIAQIGGYINFRRCTLQDFIEIFEEFWAKDSTHPLDYEKSLQTVFDIALHSLKSDARDLIDIFAYFNPDSIPEDMVFSPHRDKNLDFLNSSNKYR